jgi:hypothetical protein
MQVHNMYIRWLVSGGCDGVPEKQRCRSVKRAPLRPDGTHLRSAISASPRAILSRHELAGVAGGASRSFSSHLFAACFPCGFRDFMLPYQGERSSARAPPLFSARTETDRSRAIFAFCRVERGYPPPPEAPAASPYPKLDCSCRQGKQPGLGPQLGWP